MEKVEITVENLRQAFKISSDEIKNVLATLFGKENCTEKPCYSDYHNIKSIEDVCAALGIDKDEFEESIEDLPDDVQAFMWLRQVRNALNPKWKPNFADTNQWKYYPWFKVVPPPAGVGSAIRVSYCGVSVLHSGTGASLAYASYGGALASEKSEIAIWFGEHFADLWARFLVPDLNNDIV